MTLDKQTKIVENVIDDLKGENVITVKESVDNSLDACEEARMLPTLKIQINKIDANKDIIEMKTTVLNQKDILVFEGFHKYLVKKRL